MQMKYCEKCRRLCADDSVVKCPSCSSKKLSAVSPDDAVFLISLDSIWSGMAEDILTENEIPFRKRGILGAGMTANIGGMLESYEFFVPYSYYDDARELLIRLENIDDSAGESDSEDEMIEEEFTGDETESEENVD